MTELIPIRSAKRNNGVFGYIEGSEAFDLLGRPRAGYDPNTGLLCDLRDGGVLEWQVHFDLRSITSFDVRAPPRAHLFALLRCIRCFGKERH